MLMIAEYEKEYELLRIEMMEWQNRRFAIVGISITLVSALLGAGQVAGAKLPWEFVTVLGLFFLSVACLLTAYCGIANTKLATYLQVYHEVEGSRFRWETRLEAFPSVIGRFENLNQHISMIYLVLAVLTLCLPPLLLGSPLGGKYHLVPVVMMTLIFCLALVWLFRSQGRREAFKAHWQQIAQQETAATSG